MRNQVQLITYVDRLGGDLPGLAEVLDGPLAGLFGGVHLLPFFTPYDGADAGFDPTDHTEVDERLGDWGDVGRIGEQYELMADLIVNHMSVHADRFAAAVEDPDSPYAGMFLTFGSVFEKGATEEDLLRLYRPRPGLPFTTITLADGTRRIAWTTFTSEQIDLDVRHPETQSYLRGIIERFSASGIDVLRLDAVGYAVKTPGTSCFMTDDTLAFTDELTAWARAEDMEVLVEIHSHYQKQIDIAANVDWVYDFALPPLVLHALFTGESRQLEHWFDIRPHNAVTVLDTHDGIGVLDVGPDTLEGEQVDDDQPGGEGPVRRPGLLETDRIDALVEGIHERSNGQSREATGSAASNVDLYQVNCTYYDALGRDDDAYLLARLIQFFLPGVPQVYYGGLLAETNDMQLLETTNVGRDINRPYLDRDRIDQALRRPVVQRLMRLIRFRNHHPAFGGSWELGESGEQEVAMRWSAGDEQLDLLVDLDARTFVLELDGAQGSRTVTDVDDLPVPS